MVDMVNMKSLTLLPNTVVWYIFLNGYLATLDMAATTLKSYPESILPIVWYEIYMRSGKICSLLAVHCSISLKEADTIDQIFSYHVLTDSSLLSSLKTKMKSFLLVTRSIQLTTLIQNSQHCKPQPEEFVLW
jgi:hypothetical protein